MGVWQCQPGGTCHPVNLFPKTDAMTDQAMQDLFGTSLKVLCCCMSHCVRPARHPAVHQAKVLKKLCLSRHPPDKSSTVEEGLYSPSAAS